MLVAIVCKSRIIVWCEKRNPMWWLNSIPASCAEIGCLVSHYCAIICACLICRLKSDVWSDNAYFIFAQIRCGAAHLPCIWLFNLCLFLSDATWFCACFIADILSNSRLIWQSSCAIDSLWANRMQFAIHSLFAFPIGCCLLLAFSLQISIYIIAQFTFVN